MAINRIISGLGGIILLVFYFILSFGVEENEKQLQTQPYTNQDSGYFAITGSFTGTPLYPINQHIQAIYVKLLVRGVYEEETQTYDEDGEIEYDTYTQIDIITTQEWKPNSVYFLSNNKKLKINSPSLIEKILENEEILKIMDISQHAISYQQNQVFIRFQLDGHPFEYQFTPTKDYERIEAKLYFIPSNIPYTIFANVKNDQLLFPDYERDFYIYEGTLNDVHQQLKKGTMWISLFKWLFLALSLFSFGYFIYSFFKPKKTKEH